MASRSRGWSSTRQLEIANCCARLGRRGRRLPLASSMSIRDLIPASLRTLPRDGVLLFVSRFTRLFAYGALSVILVFYLVSLGLSEAQVGVLLTLTLAGDMAISLLLTTQADRIGRRRMLIVGAILMAGAGVAFASTKNLLFLIVAGTIGVISPSGHEVGPFLSIEQAALSHVVPARSRTEVFAWYTLAGSLATALGAFCGGAAAGVVQKASLSTSDSYRVVVLLYAALGVALAFLFTRLSSSAEADMSATTASGVSARDFLGVGRSRSIVLKLRSEEHTSELQSPMYLVCRLLLEKKNNIRTLMHH